MKAAAWSRGWGYNVRFQTDTLLLVREEGRRLYVVVVCCVVIVLEGWQETRERAAVI